MAARLYASGAVPTKRAACEAVGLHPHYLAILNPNEVTRKIIGEVDQAIHDETVSLSQVIAKLSRKAAERMGQLIESQNEHVAVKASADILDRNRETSKTFKHEHNVFSLSSEDAKELAAALVAGAEVKQRFLPIANQDFVSVELANEAQKDAGVKKDSSDNRKGSSTRPTTPEITVIRDEENEGSQGPEA